MKVILAILLLLPVVVFSQTAEQKQAAWKKALPGCERFVEFNCTNCGSKSETILTCWNGKIRKFYYSSFAMKGQVLELKRVETVESNTSVEKVKVKFNEAGTDVFLLTLTEAKGKSRSMRLQKVSGSNGSTV
jgi:hypothetical protein